MSRDFGDLFADRHHRIEAGRRVLEDEADVAAAEGDSCDREAGVPSHPPLSCRTSPPQGGRLAVSRWLPFANLGGWRKPTMELPISPLEGEMSGRTEGGALAPRLAALQWPVDAAFNPGARRQQPGNRQRQRALARAAFADDGEAFAGGDIEADILQRRHLAAVAAIGHRQIADRKQRRHDRLLLTAVVSTTPSPAR